MDQAKKGERNAPNEETGKIGGVGGLKTAGDYARERLDTLVLYGDQGQKKNGKHAKQHAGEGKARGRDR